MTNSFRITACNETALNPNKSFVLYWMIANRRPTYNFSLRYAVESAKKLKKPLVILEALRCGYRWASDRIHQFILDGIVDHFHYFKEKAVFYYPYIESKVDEGKGLLTALSEHACLIITDDFPAFMLPHMVNAAAKQVSCRLEKVDSNGLLPIHLAEKDFLTAYSFRRFFQKNIPEFLLDFPEKEPLAKTTLPEIEKLPEAILKRWPIATIKFLEDNKRVAKLPIDHSVKSTNTQGGFLEAKKRLKHFIKDQLSSYDESRNQPEINGTSGLSPYLHFGHLSVHEIFTEIVKAEKWNPSKMSPKANGKREGFWGMSKASEGFLDELITWRELGFNFCANRKDYDQFESLPDWALKTLKKHSKDLRSPLYSLKEFEQAQTHDLLWNAAQRQLVREGIIHNYLRMLWGKKILEWSTSPEEALQIMIELNNKYALDGRDPNSYTGIFWVLGRFDHPWPPERAVFGTIRYMSSENTARKFKVKNYIAKYSE